MKASVIRAIAIGIILVGVGVVVFPVLVQKENSDKQKELLARYENVVKEKRKEQQLPTPEPQQEEIDYSVMDFVEENSTDETKAIIDRQKILGLIRCEKLELEFVVVEGASRDNIRATIGHITGTAGMGGEGNCVLAGHRGGYYGTFFKYIDKLEKGDFVELIDLYERKYIYEVYEQQVVEPTALWICDPIGEEQTLTLLSCEDNGRRRRIVRLRMKN